MKEKDKILLSKLFFCGDCLPLYNVLATLLAVSMPRNKESLISHILCSKEGSSFIFHFPKNKILVTTLDELSFLRGLYRNSVQVYVVLTLA